VTPPIAWFCPGVDLTVVATEPAHKLALECGLPAARVKIIGLPVRRAFSVMREQPKEALRAKLGLDPGRRTILMTAGGAGIGGRLLSQARAVAARLAASGRPVQMAIIAGNNKPFLRRLRGVKWPIPVTPLGYVENMAEWMAASDLLITKAGPGTLAEAACVGVPVIITDFVPGQEEGNVSWVESHRAGIFVRKPAQVAALVDDLLRPIDPLLDFMAGQAFKLAQHGASEKIAEAVLEVYRKAVSVQLTARS
jgi:1,2-diacylglycerol 3-beta-galactosyltransferase